MTKSTISRKDALVRGAKARAAIVSFLNKNSGGVLPAEDISPAVQESVKIPHAAIASLLDRMATQKQIRKVWLPGRRVAYGLGKARTLDFGGGTAQDLPIIDIPREPTKKKTTLKQTNAFDIPIDIVVNENAHSITVRYGGMSITLSKAI